MLANQILLESSSFWATLEQGFYKTFIHKDTYLLFLEGLWNTLLIALAATLIGCVVGVLIACAKVAFTHSNRLKPLSWWPLRILNFFSDFYLTIMRGTPVVVQLLILYTIVFKYFKIGIIVAMVGFGLNSGAYVAEIIRAGIMAVDPGQREAGRSLGLSSLTTMWKIVLPQAIKNILPALGNEFITLLKETSVVGMIGTMDLTRAGDLVRSSTFDPYFSLFSVALVYLLLVMGLTAILRRVERRLRRSDRRSESA